MANIKISNLPTASAITSDDYMPIVENTATQTQRADFSKVLSYVTSSTFDTLTVASLTASVSGTFVGDGSGITGVTGEWDGTHTGNAEITGTLSIKNGHVNLTENAYFFQGSSTGGSNVSLIGVNSSDQIFIGNSGFQNIIDDDTYVSGNLEVSGASVTLGPATGDITIQGNTSDSLIINAKSKLVLNYDSDNNQGGSSAFYIKRNDGTAAGTRDLTVTEGKVGIGIDLPNELLEVRNSSATVGEGARIGEAKIGTWEGSTSYAAFVHNSVHATPNSYALLQSNLGETVLNTASGRTLFFKNNNSTNMVIDSAGSVGIGTTSPDANLHVQKSNAGITTIFGRGLDANFILNCSQSLDNNSGDVLMEMGLRYGTSTNKNAAIRFHRGGGIVGGFVSFTTNNDTERMRIDALGNVGIGTTNPSEKLEVVGDSIFSGSVEVSGTLRADVEVSGNITAASYTLSAADYGKTLLFSSSATQDITCSSGLDVGYNVTVIQAGTGQLNFSGSGVTLVNRFAHTSSAGQYSAVSVIVLNGTQYLVVGDTA